MTREEAIKMLKSKMDGHTDTSYEWSETVRMAIKALEHPEQNVIAVVPCGDFISRQVVLDAIEDDNRNGHYSCFASNNDAQCFKGIIGELPSVNPQEPIGHCKGCKYFEYDSWAKVNGIPLIVAHEICSRWGDGCKTSEDGYCFLFEPQESEVDE